MAMHVFCGPLFLGKELEFVEEGFVVVEDGRIADCGEGIEKGGIRRSVIPAFINAHTHVGDYFLRDACAGMSLDEACGKDGVKERRMRAAPDDVVIECMKSAILEMGRTGTCCFADFREGGILGVNLLKEALSYYGGVSARIFGRPLYIGEEFLDECDGYGARSVRAERVKNQPGKMVGIHACEAKSGELDAALEFEPDFLVHMNCASKDEINRAAELDLPIVVCPRSNAYFGLKLPDIPLMLDEGVTVCLGTDNAMTGSLSMMDEMEFTLRMMKGKVSATDVLKMSTVNPAKVFGWNSGVIEKGVCANLIFVPEPFLRSAEPYATTVLRLSSQKREIMFGGRYVHYC